MNAHSLLCVSCAYAPFARQNTETEKAVADACMCVCVCVCVCVSFTLHLIDDLQALEQEQAICVCVCVCVSTEDLQALKQELVSLSEELGLPADTIPPGHMMIENGRSDLFTVSMRQTDCEIGITTHTHTHIYTHTRHHVRTQLCGSKRRR